MFYKLKLKDHIRVPPRLFADDIGESITKSIKHTYNNFISKEIGVVIDVLKIDKIYDGTIVPGDGASYYETEFELLTFKPELHETLFGRIRDIADFGVFMNIGPIDGMIHISQTMDDFVSFSKERTLAGKDSNKSLKVGDKCIAKIIAVSFKDPANPKIGLTMRQAHLGKIEWIQEENTKSSKKSKKPAQKGKK